MGSDQSNNNNSAFSPDIEPMLNSTIARADFPRTSDEWKNIWTKIVDKTIKHKLRLLGYENNFINACSSTWKPILQSKRRRSVTSPSSLHKSCLDVDDIRSKKRK